MTITCNKMLCLHKVGNKTHNHSAHYWTTLFQRCENGNNNQTTTTNNIKTFSISFVVVNLSLICLGIVYWKRWKRPEEIWGAKYKNSSILNENKEWKKEWRWEKKPSRWQTNCRIIMLLMLCNWLIIFGNKVFAWKT